MKNLRWKLKWGTYFLGDDKYDYAHVFKCTNGGLNHGLWCALDKKACE